MAIEWNFRSVLGFIVGQLPGAVKAEIKKESLHRTATAVRIKGAPPQLDGVLDDDIWKTAPLHEGFRQRDPDEGKPTSERTTFQVIYDDEAIYIAVMCYDSEPDKISSRLVRRDTDVTSDKVDVILDPHYNRQNGLWFTVYPSGSVTKENRDFHIRSLGVMLFSAGNFVPEAHCFWLGLNRVRLRWKILEKPTLGFAPCIG